MANTPNLGLHQWGAEDSFLRTDFNQDFSKIDGAISAIVKFHSSSFTPDKKANRAITTGFRPKLVIFFGMYKCPDGYTRHAYAFLRETEMVGQYGELFRKAGADVPIAMTNTGFLIKNADAFNTQDGALIDTQYFAWG